MNKFREGDFLETKGGLIFHVKGVSHPPDRTIAFLRYIPDKDGDRGEGDTKYRKIYPVEERYKFLRSNHPHYIFYSKKWNREIQAVPTSRIKKIYRPEEKLKELKEKENPSSLEKLIVGSSEKIIEEAGVKEDRLGVTGSILVGLEKETSDIDLIAYGEEECRKVYSALKRLRKEGGLIRPYSMEEARRIAKFRWEDTGLSIQKLAELEKKKILHGMIGDRDFFMRLVKEEDEIEHKYGVYSCSQIGKFKLEGSISENGDSIFTPNQYGVGDAQVVGGSSYDIRKLFSYRGRFTEQVSKGDQIKAYGRIEKITLQNEEYYRLLLGKPEEYLVPI